MPPKNTISNTIEPTVGCRPKKRVDINGSAS